MDMKAAIYTRYGGPEVVSIQHVERPVPKDHELLVRVHASTVNRTDCGFRSAEYFVSRFFSGLFVPKSQILGCEFAGEIAAVGKDVQAFRTGERVFGFDDDIFGGHAEYKVIAAESAVVLIPDSMDYATAAAMTEGSHYALCNIRASGVRAGDTALVYGATGAIGSAAVQLLKHFGVYVVAVSDSRNVELVRALGANEVIDYMRQDFTQTLHRFDFVFDAVGKSSFGQCKPLMKPRGVYISTEFGKNGQNVFLSLTTRFGGGKRVLFPLPQTRREDIIFLKELAENGAFKPVIDRRFRLEEIVEAHRYVETGQKTGNVIIEIV